MGKGRLIKIEDRKLKVRPECKEFERLLASGGFKVDGVREYLGSMDYVISKDGVDYEVKLYCPDDKPQFYAEGMYEALKYWWREKKEVVYESRRS